MLRVVVLSECHGATGLYAALLRSRSASSKTEYSPRPRRAAIVCRRPLSVDIEIYFQLRDETKNEAIAEIRPGKNSAVLLLTDRLLRIWQTSKMLSCPKT